jgi:hypothetical protein
VSSLRDCCTVQVELHLWVAARNWTTPCRIVLVVADMASDMLREVGDDFATRTRSKDEGERVS